MAKLPSMATFKASKGIVFGSNKSCLDFSPILFWLLCGFQVAAAICQFRQTSILCTGIVGPDPKMQDLKYHAIAYAGTQARTFTNEYFPPNIKFIDIEQTIKFTFERNAFEYVHPYVSKVRLIGFDFDLMSPLSAMLHFTLVSLHIERFKGQGSRPLSLVKSFLGPQQMRNIKSLELPNNFIRFISQSFLEDAKALEVFNLQNNEITKVPECLRIFIPFIDLSHNKIRSVTSADFGHCTVHWLDLSYNAVQVLGWEGLYQQCSLKYIKLSGNFMLERLTNLKSPLYDLTIDVSDTLIDKLDFLQSVEKNTQKDAAKIHVIMRNTLLACDCQTERFLDSNHPAVSINGTCLWQGNAMELHSFELREKWQKEGCKSCNPEGPSDDIVPSLNSSVELHIIKPHRVTNELKLNAQKATVMTSTLILVVLIIFGVFCYLDIASFCIAKPEAASSV